MTIALLIIGIVALVAGIALSFIPRTGAPIAAFVGLLTLHLSYHIMVPTGYLIFWGVAATIAAMLQWLSPAGEPDGRSISNVYIVLAAIAGCLLGILLAPRVMVLGVILGAALGQMAYSSTPVGHWLRDGGWPIMMRYYGAKCLPVVIAIAIVGIAIMGFLT